MAAQTVRQLCWAWLTLAVVFIGCSGPRRARWWEWYYEKDKIGPQVSSPYQRVEKLRELAVSGSKLPDAEQQRLTNILLEDIQREEDPAMRVELLHTLTSLNNATSVAILRAALSDPNPLVRCAACEGWRKRGGAEAAPVLIRMMKEDNEFDVKMTAARELGILGDPAAVPELGVLLDDPNPAMQNRGVESLRAITGKEFGDDVTKWKSFVQGGSPAEISVVSKFIRRF